MAGALVLLVVIGLAGVWLLVGRSSPVARVEKREATPAAAEAPPQVAPEPTPEPAPETTKRRAAPRPKAARAPEAPPPSAPVPRLKVDSDVAEASVFVDRVYIGKTPVTGDLAPGSHTVTVAAEGYESQATTVEAGNEPIDLLVRFKVVRLNEAIPVVHKHGIGSCEGRLLADPHGLRYETPNKDHAFDVPFSQLKTLQVDYLQKNLRVTRKDGKTFNFTDRTPNGDALFVFQQKVEAARAKLASGMAGDVK